MKELKTSIPWRALTLLGALLLVWIIFTATTGGTFVTPRNLSLLLRQMSCTSILAIGMVLVIVCAEIDLSVGAMTGFLGVLSAILFDNQNRVLPKASFQNVKFHPGSFDLWRFGQPGR
jgi:D-xylose transport system permease protein